MLKFISKHIYLSGFKRGVKLGYKRGKVVGLKGFVTSNPSDFAPFLDIHEKATDFTVKTNIKSYEKYNPPNPLSGKDILARGGLYTIGERAVILHRSILSLSENGWVSVTPIILRSLLECGINSLAIVNKDNEYMAFKFYCNEFLNTQLDKGFSQEIRNFNMNQVRQQIVRLNQADQKRAEEYVKEFLKRKEPKSYWYRPEYRNTNDILRACKADSMYEVYKFLSGPTHSSFVGSNIFKDQPDRRDINQRKDPKSTKIALGTSARLLIEITDIRNIFENLNFNSAAQALRKKQSSLKALI